MLVASLFALHPAEGGSGNLGAAFARLRASDRTESTEKRFLALLNCHRDDLTNHVRQAVCLLKSKEIPVNWDQLIEDLLNWDNPDRLVQKDWAKSYWTGAKEDLSQGEATYRMPHQSYSERVGSSQ